MADRGVAVQVVETAELLVSEVVTNAVVHAATDIEVSVTMLDDGGVRVEVSDGSPHLPARRQYALTAGTGRGMQLVDELADRAGTTPAPPGKTVWFEVSPPRDVAQGAHEHLTGGSVADPDADVVPVELRDVPLCVHEAWREQAQALLRDYLLATVDAPDGQAEVTRHAACSAAITLLGEHIPASGGDSGSASVVVPVPRELVSDFAVLDQTLDRALDRAAEGLLLAPATEAETRAFRRWVCREVRRQARGHTPQAWAPRA